MDTIPASIVYEDKDVIAFLDRKQVRPGHTMVIPKQHIDHFIDLPDAIAAHIAVIGNRIGRRMQEMLKPKRVGMVISGFGVAHAHYHVIPMHDENDITSQQYVINENGVIQFTHNHLVPKTMEENRSILELIKL